MNPFMLKAFLLIAVGFLGGMHIGKSQNPNYDDDGLGPDGHRIIGAIFLTGGFIGVTHMLWEMAQIIGE